MPAPVTTTIFLDFATASERLANVRLVDDSAAELSRLSVSVMFWKKVDVWGSRRRRRRRRRKVEVAVSSGFKFRLAVTPASNHVASRSHMIESTRTRRSGVRSTDGEIILCLLFIQQNSRYKRLQHPMSTHKWHRGHLNRRIIPEAIAIIMYAPVQLLQSKMYESTAARVTSTLLEKGRTR